MTEVVKGTKTIITKNMVSKYKNLVNRNCHGVVLEEIARDVNATYFVNLFESINKIHAIEGSLSSDVYAVRNRIKEDFRNYLLHYLSDSEYKLVARYI